MLMIPGFCGESSAQSRRNLPDKPGSGDAPGLDSSLSEQGVKPSGQFGQLMAGYFRIEVVFQMICQLQEERRDDRTAPGCGSGSGASRRSAGGGGGP